MIGLLIFLALGVAVSNYGKPLQLAGAFIGLNAALSLAIGSDLSEVLLSSLIYLPFTAAVYLLVHRYSESILATYGILLAAIAVMFSAAIYL